MEKKDLIDSHTHFSNELTRLEEEIAPVRQKALDLDATIQAAKSDIQASEIELRRVEIDRKRPYLVAVELRITSEDFKKMEEALADKEKQLEALLFQKKELREHIDFLQNCINDVKRRLKNIRITLAEDLITKHAGAVAKAAGQSLNDLIAALVAKSNQLPAPMGVAGDYRGKLFQKLGEAIYQQGLTNLDVAGFGIPKTPEAQQKVGAMIEAMGQEHA